MSHEALFTALRAAFPAHNASLHRELYAHTGGHMTERWSAYLHVPGKSMAACAYVEGGAGVEQVVSALKASIADRLSKARAELEALIGEAA